MRSTARYRPLPTATAALALAGALLAVATAGPAFTGLGAAHGLAFLAVTVAGIRLAAAVLQLGDVAGAKVTVSTMNGSHASAEVSDRW